MRCAVNLSRLSALAVALLLVPLSGFAQAPAAGRVEVGGDLRVLIGVHFNDVNAAEAAFGGTSRVVFRSVSRLEPAACAEGRIALAVTPVFDVEGSGSFGRTHLTTAITEDPEAADVSITEPLTTYLLEGGIVAHPARWRRGRAAPFVSGGLGYLRQIHDGGMLVQGGAVWYAGGGLRYPLKDADRRGLGSAALRFELRATILRGGTALDGDLHVLPAAIAGVFFHF
jgi:opacity protein-like surface antigen